jgi:GNAT superfamily N-acetyltransferase
MGSLEIVELCDKADRDAMAVFPWTVYRGDKNWVPPLIKDRKKQFDPQRNLFFQNADVALFAARREGQMVGTIAAFVDRGFNASLKLRVGYFGFFEVLNDYPAAEALLGAARDWLRQQGMTEMRGPINFHRDRERGILVEGADCPPPILCAHTPPYYKDFVTRFGMVKHADDFCRRIWVPDIVGPDGSLPPRLARLQKVAERRAHFTIRRAHLADWDAEVRLVGQLYDATIGQLPDHVPWSPEDLASFAQELRPVVDPEFALFGEVKGQTVGCALAFPDLYQVLIHLNGSLDGLNKLRAWWYMRRINILSFKVAGVIDQYQGLGIEALLLLEMAKSALKRGYRWVDLSLQAEGNDKVNHLVQHFRVEDYKRYRVYTMPL